MDISRTYYVQRPVACKNRGDNMLEYIMLNSIVLLALLNRLIRPAVTEILAMVACKKGDESPDFALASVSRKLLLF